MIAHLADHDPIRTQAQNALDRLGHAFAFAHAILLVLAGLTLFFKGKSIEENLDAWINMCRRFVNVLKRLRRFAGHVYVSEPAGSAIATSFLTDLIPGMNRVSLLNSQIFIADPSGFREWAWYQFRAIPERYYLYCFNTDNRDTHIICVKSTGQVEFHHRLPTGNWQEFYGVISAPPPPTPEG